MELMKGEFVGKYKITRAMSLVKEWKDAFNDDDDDDVDDVEDDDVDGNDEQEPVDVFADNVLPGSCFIF